MNTKKPQKKYLSVRELKGCLPSPEKPVTLEEMEQAIQEHDEVENEESFNIKN